MEKTRANDARAPKGPSSSQTFERSNLDSLIERIASLLGETDRNAWLVGDLLFQAFGHKLDGRKATYERLREKYPTLKQWSVSYLCQLRLTAEAFDEQARERAREKGAGWYECDQARRSRNNCVRRGVGQKDEPLNDHLGFILEQKGSQRINARTATKRRVERATKSQQAERAAAAQKAQSENAEWLRYCRQGSCLNELREADDGSVALVWADPPYGQYAKQKDGGLSKPYNGAILSECANNDRATALGVTLEVIRQAERVMAEKSALVLFQAAIEPDRPEVIMAARQAGFGYIIPMYWNKRLPQPSDFALPFSVQTERILVMARNRDSFYENEDRKGRTDVLNDDVFERLYGENGEAGMIAEAPSREFHRKANSGEAPVGTVHQMEKPGSLCRYFLERLTIEGDLVLDLFGCSGSMACACIRHGRRWRYSELNKLNYELGLANIGRAVNESPVTPSRSA